MTPEYLAWKEANRKAVFAGGLWDENIALEGEDGISKVTKSQQKHKAFKCRHSAEKHQWNLLSKTEPQQFEKLYQDEEDISNECLYTKYTGKTLALHRFRVDGDEGLNE